MCRAGGRRCPSHLSGLARKARNAQRRAEYSTMKIEQLNDLANDALKEEGNESFNKILGKIEKHQASHQENSRLSVKLYQQYVHSIAENAMISDAQEAGAEQVHPSDSLDINDDKLKESISALPPVFGDKSFEDKTGEDLFRDTDEITSSNPELGIYKTKNTGVLADLRYFNPETIRGTIIKSKITKNSAHEDFGFRHIKHKKAYEIENFNALKNLEYYENTSESELHSTTDEERKGLNTFTGGSFLAINRSLYEQSKDGVPEYLMKHIEGIDAAMSKSPKRQRYTYRAMQFDAQAVLKHESAEKWAEEKFQLGEDVVFDGYQSSSPHKDGFEDFSSENGVLLEILTPEGANITSASKFEQERETLLPRNARYKVVGFEKKVTLLFFGTGEEKRPGNTVVRLVAVNAKGEVLDGSNADELAPIENVKEGGLY